MYIIPESAQVFIQDVHESIRIKLIQWWSQNTTNPQSNPGDLITHLGFMYQIANYGKTPAILKEISTVMTCDDLPAIPSYPIQDRKEFESVYGRVLYDDVFGKSRELRFIWEYSGAGLRRAYEIATYNKNT